MPNGDSLVLPINVVTHGKSSRCLGESSDFNDSVAIDTAQCCLHYLIALGDDGLEWLLTHSNILSRICVF